MIAIVDAAIVVAPRAALRGPEEACPRDVTMDADRSASELDVLLSHVSASAIEAVCLRMIDSLDRETLMETGPGRRFVGVDDRAVGNTGADEWLFVLKTAGIEFAARSRISTITLRLPYLFRANEGRDGILLVDASARPAKIELIRSMSGAKRYPSNARQMMGIAEALNPSAAVNPLASCRDRAPTVRARRTRAS